MTKFVQMLREEGLKWALGIVLAAVVFVAAVYFAVNPMIQRAVTRVQDLNETITHQEIRLQTEAERLVEMEAQRNTLGEQLALWEERVGRLINDPELTEDVRTALEHMKALPEDERDFVMWQRSAADRIDALESRSSVIATGSETFAESPTNDFVNTKRNGWYRATTQVSFEDEFQHPPTVFISVASISFQHHEAAPFTYWVQVNKDSVTTEGFEIIALVGSQPPEKFRGFRVHWIAIEPEASPTSGP